MSSSLARPKTNLRRLLMLAAALASWTGAAGAQELKPAIVYDIADAFGKAANESARRGADRFKSEAGIVIETAEPQSEGQREEALRRFASGGFWPIIAIGGGQAGALDKVAKQFPAVRFTIVDGLVDLANVQSIAFKEQEGSFLAGVIAAKATRSGKVAFLGGMDGALTRRHACGFAQGVKYANSKVELFQNMAGAASEAWNDPVKGAEIARGQIDRGADVIFQVARGTGLGALRAIADAGKLGIGSDVNQNGLYPGNMLSSMVKRYDVATETALKSGADGSWKAGLVSLGVKEQGIGIARDDSNRAILKGDVKTLADQAAGDIASGLVRVHDYAADQQCAM